MIGSVKHPLLLFGARLARNRTGVAAVEFALCLPFLMMILMGIFDFGGLAYTYMQVNAAAHAGAQQVYFAAACNTTNISTAVTRAVSATVTASPAPSCGNKECVTSNALVTTTGSTCPSGDSPGYYAIVNASAAVTPIAPWSSFVLPSTLTAKAVIRYQ